MYHYTGTNVFKESAVFQEKRLDKALVEFRDIHHDVGFLWLPTSVAHYREDGDQQALRTGLHAANLLAGRLNLKGAYLVAWNDHPGWLIIDSMMNIQLLYWATQVTKDPRFEQIATRHAKTVAKYLIRNDGSTSHIANFDPKTGEFIENLAGQGINSNSTWSRGCAWALYGFVLSYKKTKEDYFLQVAERVASYFISQVMSSSFIPLADFSDQSDMKVHDVSAGCIAACGLLKLSRLKIEKNKFYYEVGTKMLRIILKNYANFYSEEDGIIDGGTEAYYRPATYEVPLVYSDYFMLEGLLAIKGSNIEIF